MKNILTYFVFLFLLLIAGCHNRQKPSQPNLSMVQITDMAGRTVEVPKIIKSMVCSDMTATFFIYALAPDLLAGRNTKPSDAERKMIPQQFLDLPVLGVIFYGKSTFNVEAVSNLHPDILLCPLFQHTTSGYIADYESFGKKMGIPVVMVSLDLERLPEAFLFMGKLLHKEQQAGELAGYCQKTLNWADSVRSNVRDTMSVYIAEGTHGLNTIPAVSTHSKVIGMAGAKNCATVDEAYGYKDMAISFEQILNWNPDYLIINSRSSAGIDSAMVANLLKDKVWQSLDAVKNNRILVVPTVPFNWIGRPPGINRLIGIRWLASELYPKIAHLDMAQEVSRFYSLFYHVRLTEGQIKALLNRH